jgi:UrcA family protein
MFERSIPMLAACAVTAAGLAIAAPAVAKQEPVVVTATAKDIPIRYVSYRDLNLARFEDEQRLLKRVKYAVKDVCIESSGGEAVPRDSSNRLIMNHCRGHAWAGAQPQVNRAVQRAREIAYNGFSTIAPVAISISVP